MDIRELVMDTGVAGRSYSIVEQGRVEEFISASPAERRGYMEEAAGIVRYKTKRVAAEKKLEQTGQNLLRVEDVLGELTRQEGQLRAQMETAREFRGLQSEVASLHGSLVRFRHDASLELCTGVEAPLQTLREQASGLEQVMEALPAGPERLRRGRWRPWTPIAARRCWPSTTWPARLTHSPRRSPTANVPRRRS